MQKIKAVILDVDGTLVDSNALNAQVWADALAASGVTVEIGVIRPLIGMGGDNLIPRVVGVTADSAPGKEISERRTAMLKARMGEISAFPQARELVARLRDSGLKVAVASSAKTDELRPLLKLVDAEWLLDDDNTASSSEAEKSKPDADIVHAALKKTRSAPSETLMIGDTPYDIEAGAKAGVGVIALRCGGWDNKDFTGAVAVYADPADLLANFDGSPLSK